MDSDPLGDPGETGAPERDRAPAPNAGTQLPHPGPSPARSRAPRLRRDEAPGSPRLCARGLTRLPGAVLPPVFSGRGISAPAPETNHRRVRSTNDPRGDPSSLGRRRRRRAELVVSRVRVPGKARGPALRPWAPLGAPPPRPCFPMQRTDGRLVRSVVNSQGKGVVLFCFFNVKAYKPRALPRHRCTWPQSGADVEGGARPGASILQPSPVEAVRVPHGTDGASGGQCLPCRCRQSLPSPPRAVEVPSQQHPGGGAEGSGSRPRIKQPLGYGPGPFCSE